MNDRRHFIIDPEIQKKIDHWLTKYPPEQKRSAVVPALLYVQEQNNGWLSHQRWMQWHNI